MSILSYPILQKKKKKSIPSYSFHSLPLKLSNNGIEFPFPPLKLLLMPTFDKRPNDRRSPTI